MGLTSGADLQVCSCTGRTAGARAGVRRSSMPSLGSGELHACTALLKVSEKIQLSSWRDSYPRRLATQKLFRNVRASVQIGAMPVVARGSGARQGAHLHGTAGIASRCMALAHRGPQSAHWRGQKWPLPSGMASTANVVPGTNLREPVGPECGRNHRSRERHQYQLHTIKD